MTSFSVWAPAAKRVDLLVGSERVAMAPGERGRFCVSVPGAGHGTDYRFSLDGGPGLADPRSPWQPGGIDGPSRVLDHAQFSWSDQAWLGATPAWLSGGAIYELHVGTFTPPGTFLAAIDRLDHLVGLGVRAVELMPLAESSGAHGWGYDGVFLYAPHHPYGPPDQLKALVDACHARGMAAIIDVVYNHLGPLGNVLAQFGPYFTDRYVTPWGAAVNLDGAGSDESRRFFLDNALMWLADYHFDGLRIDAVHAIVDTSAVHFLEELAFEAETLAASRGRQITLIAESDLNDPRLVRPRELGGYGLQAVWNEDFHHALHAFLTGERSGYYSDFGSLGDVARCLERAAVYDGRYSAFRQRRHGRPATGLSGQHFVGFLQNHDQVGNRALGERTAALMSLGRLKVGAALVLLSPFIPLLFQGEEWAAGTPFQYFTDHQDAELGRAVSEGRRREFKAFGWDPSAVPDPQDPGTFRRSKLAWEELDRAPHAEVLAWHRDLLALRARLPELLGGRLEDVETSYSDAGGWLRVRRGPAEIVANLGAAVLDLAVDAAARVTLASDAAVRCSGGSLRLPPDSVAVLLDADRA